MSFKFQITFSLRYKFFTREEANKRSKMFKGLLLAFLIVIGLNICENAVLTIFTWRSFIQKPGELQPTFKSKIVNFID